MTELRKFRYEFPPMEPHFVQAPGGASVVAFVKRTYPHNYDEVLPTIVEVPRWPEFYKTLDERGRVLPRE
ncbi:MAG: hypothetical protein AAF721_32765 [Myxococcota bacterium]